MIQLDGYATKNNLALEDYSLGLGESLSATADQTWIENPTSAISRLLELNQATATYEPGMVGEYKPEKALLDWNTQQQAEQKAKEAGVDLKFSDVGIGQEKLDILIERKRAETKRKTIMSMGPQGFLPGAAKLGTSLAVSMADPLNVASAFIPVVSQANAARLGARLGVHGGRVATGVVEGAVGAAMVEPIVYAAMSAEQADYDLYDSYMNVVFGAVIGGGLHAGLGAIGDAISKAPAQTKSDLLQSATGQALDNKPVDVGRVADEANLSTATRSADGSSVTLPRGVDYQAADGSGVVTVRTTNEFGDTVTEVKLVEPKEQLPRSEFKSDEDFARYEALRSEVDSEIRNGRAIIDDLVEQNKAKYSEEDVAKHSSEADPKVAAEAQEKLNLKPEETPETVDALTNDIMTSLDEIGADTAPLRAELAETNKRIAQESEAMRSYAACMIG